MNIYIYALRLENYKYYIGKTTNPEFRINDHLNSNGSSWTNKYKPIEIMELYYNCDSFDEDKYTIIYMNQYGIDNVRGGSFTTLHLDKTTRKVLQKMIHTANDKCYKCGNYGHFARECSNKNQGSSEEDDESFVTEVSSEEEEESYETEETTETLSYADSTDTDETIDTSEED